MRHPYGLGPAFDAPAHLMTTYESHATPPIVTEDLPGSGGYCSDAPEDFQVDEVPAYEPSGEGDHHYIRVEKTMWSTPAMVRAIAKICRVAPRDIGTAGMKDKHAVTTQWVSLPPGASLPEEDTWTQGIRVIERSRHKNKLRTGHVLANRFQIRLHGADLTAARAIAERILSTGIPNAFGAQRFGRDQENLATAIQWIRTGRTPGPRFDPKFAVSVMQSAFFNRYISRRTERGLTVAVLGEYVRLADTGSFFFVDDVVSATERLARRDIVLTGPLPGSKLSVAGEDALEVEQAAAADIGIPLDTFASLGRRGAGTRRDLTVRPESLEVVEDSDHDAIVLRFQLPAGSFATLVAREFTRRPWDAPLRDRGEIGKVSESHE